MQICMCLSHNHLHQANLFVLILSSSNNIMIYIIYTANTFCT